MRCIYIPTNAQNSHRTMLIIFIVEKNIRYYDSMNGGGDHFLDAARRWVVDEGRVKKNITIDPEDWTLVSRQAHVPQQGNGFDCGVFSCMCADYISDDLPLQCYSQDVMPLMRKKMAAAILRGSLDYSQE